jgi:probable rRNA maturation factor
MCDLHRRFLNKSDPTDVITFNHGEIFISVETARKQARRFKTSVLHEVQLYIVHGLLHLHGFDHRGEADARAMDELQKKILKRIANAQR